eukprot:CAMPEP_0181218374 /NCGR_PEP_ID=MMETSP1096-20121128/27662_1 /TAXON_ID=156174 ORGANISM="Chrysochromulina ericina, Strain CCMP281" /NCGR_SAMPLE_ID=MMETSP1096 /ASSEMBLY_ACC=CAM_ASM_000453 /LENGTH=327 /DNA_ID=CAMNT_0023310591 /DNA_START=78 /DNA_END=1061 /DNA_ORIENTATION=+
MVYANVTGCATSVSFQMYGTEKFNNRQGWNEYTPVQHLKIVDNPFVQQVAHPPSDLPMVCPTDKALTEACDAGAWSRPDPTSLIVFQQRNVQFIACSAFMPPGISREHFFQTYAAMARLLRLNAIHGAGARSAWKNYYSPTPLPPHTLALHLRTGRTQHDLKTGAGMVESRFKVPFELLKVAVQKLSRRAKTRHLYVAHDDVTVGNESTSFILQRMFPDVLMASNDHKRNVVAYVDHRLLSTAKVVLTFSFSSFSWTASQMGGAPYYVMNCTADRLTVSGKYASGCSKAAQECTPIGTKCEMYTCMGCDHQYKGVRTLPHLSQPDQR